MPGKWFRQDIKGAIQPPPVWPVSTREFVLVFAEFLPVFGSYPECISARPHAIIPFGLCGAALLVPTASDPLKIEVVAIEIPFAPRQ